jgi:hypothetical protein
VGIVFLICQNWFTTVITDATSGALRSVSSDRSRFWGKYQVRTTHDDFCVTEGVAQRPAGLAEMTGKVYGYCTVMEEGCGKVMDGWSEGKLVSKAQNKLLEFIIHALY